jgi:hypothetical protein
VTVAEPLFEIRVPDGFERVEAGDAQLAVRAVAPDPGGFHANLTVLVEEPTSGLELDACVDESLRQHEAALPAFHLIDRASDRLAGAPAVRTLAHHAAGGRALVLEQWRVLHRGALVTVSVTCPALDWPHAQPVLSASAATLRLP